MRTLVQKKTNTGVSETQFCAGEPAVPTTRVVQQAGNGCVGDAIKQLRKAKGFSQEELASKASVSRTTIARVECGIFKSLSIKNLESIARALSIDLKSLLLKAQVAGESVIHRGSVNQVEFCLDYPEKGFRIVSLLPKTKSFFFGRIEVDAKTTVQSDELPHPDQVCFHVIEGKFLLQRGATEYLLKAGDFYAFPGITQYDIYNPDPMKPASSLFITHPSFLSV